jgi:hypothetical protein
VENRETYYCVGCGCDVYSDTHEEAAPRKFCATCGGTEAHGMYCSVLESRILCGLRNMPE